jgi:hypothetical protein
VRAVNLIPTGQRRRGADSPGVYAVLGVLTLVLVGVTALVLASNQVASRRHDLAGATQRRAAMTTQISALQPYMTFATLEQTRAETVRTLAASRFHWDRAMRGLTRVTTSQVWLTNMLGTVAPDVTVGTGSSGSSGSSSGASGGGGAGKLRDALPNPAIELTGCGVSNRAVVAYTSRLRALRGVVRVSLSDTQKPDQVPVTDAASASDSSTAGGAAGSSDGCGPNPRIATFDAVVFFTPLPTAVAPGTVATAAPAPAAATTGATP